MPTTRKRKTHNSIELNGFVLTHLEIGDCLIPAAGKGCFCGLRDHDGNEREDLTLSMQARMGINYVNE